MSILQRGKGSEGIISLSMALKGQFLGSGAKIQTGIQKREEYHLSAKDGDPFARTILLNGVPLELTEDGNIPPLYLVEVSAN
jgi:heparanase 1